MNVVSLTSLEAFGHLRSSNQHADGCLYLAVCDFLLMTLGADKLKPLSFELTAAKFSRTITLKTKTKKKKTSWIIFGNSQPANNCNVENFHWNFFVAPSIRDRLRLCALCWVEWGQILNRPIHDDKWQIVMHLIYYRAYAVVDNGNLTENCRHFSVSSHCSNTVRSFMQ